MSVLINSLKSFGFELDIYKHSKNLAADSDNQDHYFDGYIEIVVTITPEHGFINPNEYRVLVVAPIDGRQVFTGEGRLFVLTASPFEQYLGVHHEINHEWNTDGVLGADLLHIITKPLNTNERKETLVMRHGKGILIPDAVLMN